MKTIKLQIPDSISSGRGGTFKKGIIGVLLETAQTPLEHTPDGHEEVREEGEKFGRCLVEEIAKIVAS